MFNLCKPFSHYLEFGATAFIIGATTIVLSLAGAVLVYALAERLFGIRLGNGWAIIAATVVTATFHLTALAIMMTAALFILSRLAC